MAHVVEAEALGKRYRLGDSVWRGKPVAELITGTLRRGRRGAPAEEEWLWALRDLSFAVEEGESVGLVGRNGAGKSTLLKVLARITDPTTGVARTRGRMGALLEVGTAFHPELTGRENVEINGALLGMRRRDVRRRFDDIVAFAGVEGFLDTPLKRYSSGMFMRLAFAVAAHFEPDVVVVDEVLAVGDAEFQARCLGKMGELGREGRTVLFVSHDLGAIGQLCSRTLWLEHGGLRADGPSRAVLADYLREALAHGGGATMDGPRGDEDAGLLAAAVRDEHGGAVDAVFRGDPVAVSVRVRSAGRLAGLDLGLWIGSLHTGRLVHEILGDDPDRAGLLDAAGEHEVTLRLPALLTPGEYHLGATLAARDRPVFDGELLTFRVLPRPDDRAALVERARLTSPAVDWRVA